jgi:hypothetical protein
MKRLYNFFLFLFLVLFLVSLIYGTIISWATYKILQSTAPNGITIHAISFSSFIKFGLVQAFLYSLVLLLAIIFLMKRSIDNSQKFTVRNIITITSWFFIATTLVFGIHVISFFDGWNFSSLLLLTGPQFALPAYIWFPFPLAWLTLFTILAVRIKKSKLHGC